MEQDDVKVTEILVSPKTVASLVVGCVIAYGWMFANFVSASDFDKHIDNFDKHIQTYELDRTDDKIDDLEFQIFNLQEAISVPQGNTMERRAQLSKYEGSLKDYRRQQRCLEDSGTNCRRKR